MYVTQILKWCNSVVFTLYLVRSMKNLFAAFTLHMAYTSIISSTAICALQVARTMNQSSVYILCMAHTL